MTKQDFLDGKPFYILPIKFAFFHYTNTNPKMLFYNESHYQGVVNDVSKMGFEIISVLFGRKFIYFDKCQLKEVQHD